MIGIKTGLEGADQNGVMAHCFWRMRLWMISYYLFHSVQHRPGFLQDCIILAIKKKRRKRRKKEKGNKANSDQARSP